MQAVRGRVPRAGDHDRIGNARGQHAPHDALRHRPDEVHLLRFLRRELPGRFDRRDADSRVPRRKARRPVFHEGYAARGGRPLREGHRRGEGCRRAVSLIVFAVPARHERAEPPRRVRASRKPRLTMA
ncbi:hypothetical protein F01_260036 [Burkholderia cenocepacia]|nr:hypothetical protein F01_260036 [Burkholderia cenocepacia]